MAFYNEPFKRHYSEFDEASNELALSNFESETLLTEELFKREVDLARKVRASLYELHLINKAIQRSASLGIQPDCLDPLELTKHYRNASNLFEALRRRWRDCTSLSPLRIQEMLKEIWQLQTQLCIDSTVIEYPTEIREPKQGKETKQVTVDRSPLIRSANKAMKFSKKKLPTFQIRVRAVGDQEKLVQSFKATVDLVTAKSASEVILQADSTDIGRIGTLSILHQANSTTDHQYRVDKNGCAVFDTDDKECSSTLCFDENNALQAIFEDVKVNMKGRNPNVNNRYFLRATCTLLVKLEESNGQLHAIQMTVLSQPFLIYKNDKATKRVLGAFIWDTLHTLDNNDGRQECDGTVIDYRMGSTATVYKKLQDEAKDVEGINWRTIKALLKCYPRVAIPGARQSHEEEIKTLQCMLFLPLVIEIKNVYGDGSEQCYREMMTFEKYLFGNYETRTTSQGIERMKYRLLRDPIKGNVVIKRKQLLGQKCISFTEGIATPMDHSVWEWYYHVMHMIRDKEVDLCSQNPSSLQSPDVPLSRNANASMMLELFNHSFITMCSQDVVEKIFKAIVTKTRGTKREAKAIITRFDEQLDSLCFTYSSHLNGRGLPMNAYRSVEELKRMEYGLINMLMLNEVASRYTYMIALVEKNASLARKGKIFEAHAVREKRVLPRRHLEIDVETGFAPINRDVFVLRHGEIEENFVNGGHNEHMMVDMSEDDRVSTRTYLTVASTVQSVARRVFRLIV